MRFPHFPRFARSGLACATFASIGTATALGAGPVIDTPAGGWRNSQNEQLRFTQEVHYPASSVNTPESQNQAALIRGHIAGAPKPKGARPKGRHGHAPAPVAEATAPGPKVSPLPQRPLQLIVNGLDMPLSTDGQSFMRPYLFGPGSNGVEVRSADGASRSRVQFFEAAAGAVAAKLSVLLSWDTDQTDLDLHLVTPDGGHCFYGHRVLDNGAALDVDVTTGYGPEIISSTSPVPGEYFVYINYYGSGGGSDLTVAHVTVVHDQNTPDERRETVTVPMRRSGDLTLAQSFRVR